MALKFQHPSSKEACPQTPRKWETNSSMLIQPVTLFKPVGYTVLQFLLKSLCSFLTIKEQLKAEMFITVKDATYTVVKRKPEKSQACRDSKPWPVQNWRSALTIIKLTSQLGKLCIKLWLSSPHLFLHPPVSLIIRNSFKYTHYFIKK